MRDEGGSVLGDLLLLKEAAQMAGFNVAAPAVQVALLEMYASGSREVQLAQLLSLGERLLDELRRYRPRDY